jgi:hypothetical protein
MATTAVERETAELSFVDMWMNFSGPIEGHARVDVPDWSNTNMAMAVLPGESRVLRLPRCR